MFENLFRLDRKVAVVTGAGNGLGRAFSLGLAAHGATVICADRNLEGADETASLAKQSRGVAEAMHVDVADVSSVDTMWDKIAADYGRVDILINNAGIATKTARTHEFSLEDWDQLMAINLRGVFLVTRRALALMLPGPGIDHQHRLDRGLARLLAGISLACRQLLDLQSRCYRLHPPGRGRVRQGENSRQRDRARMARRHRAWGGTPRQRHTG